MGKWRPFKKLHQLSFGLGFIVGYILLFGWPAWWPEESRQWFFYLAIFGSLWDLRTHTFRFNFSISDLFLKFVFLLLIAWWMFKPIFQHIYTTPQELFILGLIAVLGVFVWVNNELVESLFPIPIFILSHSLFVSSLALLLVLTGSASTSQMIGVLASCTGVLFLFSLFQWPIPRMISILSILECFFSLYSYYYVEVKWWYLAILFLSLLAPYGLKVFSRQNRIVFQLLIVASISILFIATPLVLAFLNEGTPY